MADTGDQRYSKKESLNRIFKTLAGATVTDDRPDMALSPEVFSEDGALSKIAELLAESLPGYLLYNPLTAYGQIYAWTGTASMESIGTTAVKITGTFQNTSYTYGVTGQPTQDRLLLTKSGYYFIDWSLSFFGSPDIEYLIEPFHHGLGMPYAGVRVKPYASGSAVSVASGGIFWASGSAELIDLRTIASSAGAWMKPWTAQITVYRIGDYY